MFGYPEESYNNMFGYSQNSFNTKKKKKRIIIISMITAAFLLISAGIGGFVYYKTVYSKPYGKYDLNDYIKVAKYNGLRIKKEPVKITKKQVNEKIEDNVEATATIKEVKKGKVNNGDTLNIDYVGTIDGKKFKNGSAKNTDITIGSGVFVNGFESNLIGAKVGEKTTIHLTFPEDYTEEKLAGKKATFEVTINSKEEKKVPKYNDDWVKENTKYSTTKEYKDSVEEDLYKKAEKENKKEIKEKLWEKVVKKSKVKKYPKDEVKRIKKSIIRQYKIYAKQYKMKYKDFLVQQMDIKSIKEFEKELNKYAKDSVKQEEIAYYIAKKENLEITEKEYKSFKKSTLKDYGYENEKEFKKAIGKSYEQYAGKMNIYSEICKEKVKKFIYDHAKISE